MHIVTLKKTKRARQSEVQQRMKAYLQGAGRGRRRKEPEEEAASEWVRPLDKARCGEARDGREVEHENDTAIAITIAAPAKSENPNSTTKGLCCVRVQARRSPSVLLLPIPRSPQPCISQSSTSASPFARSSLFKVHKQGSFSPC